MFLQSTEVMIENYFYCFRVERVISNYRIDTIDKLRRKALSYCAQRDTFESGREICLRFSRRALESNIGIDLFHHLPGAEITGEKDQTLFEINRSVITQA